MGYASARGHCKQARKNEHSRVTSAFHAYLEYLDEGRPLEGSDAYRMILAAFKAGFEAARSRP